jgi:hypothetical protein
MREDADGMKWTAVTNGRAPSKRSAGDVKRHQFVGMPAPSRRKRPIETPTRTRAVVVPSSLTVAKLNASHPDQVGRTPTMPTTDGPRHCNTALTGAILGGS